MYNITLICTRHEEIGNCNSWELYKIIDAYQPDIIFEELSPAAYRRCYVIRDLVKLEPTAIEIYLQINLIEHIPVVGSELHDDFRCMITKMSMYKEWRNTVANLEYSEEKDGFQFLNSAACEQIFDDLKKLEKKILLDSDDDILPRIYYRGHKAINNYEDEIINNIYHYSSENKYNNALMFIGAAHKKSIIKKIQEYEKINKLKLNWHFINP